MAVPTKTHSGRPSGWPAFLIEERPRPERIRTRPGAWWFAVATVCFGAFMGQLDASIVTLTYSSLRSEFHATLAAVADPFHQDPVQIGFTQDEPYFNSGVLLIDMQRWRARDCERRVFDILARRGHELTWMDQDALNMALRGEVRFLDPQWNWQPRCADVPAAFLGLDEIAYERRRAAPGIVHYTTSLKPWNAAYRVHYSALFFTAARASRIPAQRLPTPPRPRGVDQHLLQLKTRLRWRVPGVFRTMRKLFRPSAAAAMYRAGPSSH